MTSTADPGDGLAVQDLLARGTQRLTASGSGTPALDAELLLSFAAGVVGSSLAAYPEAHIGRPAVERYDAAIRRREAGEPVAYIRGVKQFHGLELRTAKRVFIPRPDSEPLVRLALLELARILRTQDTSRAHRLRVVDVGTGSGAVILALAVQLRLAGLLDAVVLHATDVSPDAVELARENAVLHGLTEDVAFEACDLLPPAQENPWDLVLANLPYIRSGAVARLPPAAMFEPMLALDGGDDGLAIVRRLLDRLPGAIAHDGAAIIEIGPGQRARLARAVADQLPGWSCEQPGNFGCIVRSGQGVTV